MRIHTKQRYAAAAVILSACGLSEEPGLELSGEPGLEFSGEDAERRSPPAPGAPGIGDPLFPTLGNGGYEVEHYDLDLRYATAAPTQGLEGTVTIRARATHALSRFNLDFAGASVGAVEVDGCAAASSWEGEELVITPARPLRRGERFTVRVSQFTAEPVPANPDVLLSAPFFSSPDGTAWAAQPNNAHRIFPSNDHPRDMASFSFRIDVPAGTTAVANGRLVGQHTWHGRSIWRYEQPEPMATELAQVAVGAFAVTDRGRHHGVRVRDITPARLAAGLEPVLAAEVAHLDWMRSQVGPYPFKTYGSLVVDAPLGFALETQTMPIYDVSLFAAPEPQYAQIMVHELAHQWFGNSVAPSQWSDVWQNEGHATWYQLTFQREPDSAELEQLAQLIYSLGDIWRTFFGPVAAPLSGDAEMLFNPNVYYGGALVLYALREQVGDAAFRQIQREWVSRYRGRSVGTADFIALASEISGQDLTEFLEAWLFGATTPPMPGHPEWTVDPVEPPPAPLAPQALAGGARGAAAQVPMKGLPPIVHRH